LRFASARSRAASLHQKTFDVSGHTVSIPARPYLGFDDADKAEVLAILGDYLSDGAAA
jgi:phage gpG-like protein